MQKWIILVVFCVIILLGVVIVLNIDIETEYIPETEIEEEELRKTIVTLYFVNKENGELSKETRLIDSKKLLREPYKELLNMLISGPENGNNIKIIPDGTNIIDITYESGCVTINFSKEFLENKLSDSDIELAINSIQNTLKELTEVINIKILIEGEEKEELTKYFETESTQKLDISNDTKIDNRVTNNTENNFAENTSNSGNNTTGVENIINE